MLLDDILERNERYVRTREAQPLAPPGARQLAVVACYDPRLDALLLPALGLAQGEAFLLRTAAALVLPGGGVMRSLGLAVFMFGVREILVLGHSSCRMAQFKNAEFATLFRARGVPRDAFGSEDLREWAGAIASPERGVERSVETISGAAFLPRDVVVSGAVLDDTTGEMHLVMRGGERASSIVEALEPPEPEPELVSAPAEQQTTSEVKPLIEAIADAVTQIEQQSKWRYETHLLRRELSQARGPVAQYRLLDSFLRRIAGESHEVASSLDGLRKIVGTSDLAALPDSLKRLLRRLAKGGLVSIGLLYIGLLVVGVAYALVATALGWFADLGGGDVHVDASGHMDAGHPHPISGTTIATFITGFGAGGTLAHYSIGLRGIASIGIATASGLVLALAAFGVLELIFKHTQAGAEYREEEIVGRDAEVITPIPAEGMGEIAYSVRGQREQAGARSSSGAAILKGRVVVIERVAGPTAWVRPKD